jgi:hypothetical protein
VAIWPQEEMVGALLELLQLLVITARSRSASERQIEPGNHRWLAELGADDVQRRRGVQQGAWGLG